MPLSHVADDGSVVMVDVSEKPKTARIAVAEGTITMKRETFEAIRSRTLAKGDALATAQIAGIIASKQTSSLIPLCHPLFLSHVAVSFTFQEETPAILCRCETKTTTETGVEMEALTGCSVALLTIYDMCKAMDRGMRIGEIHVALKDGGKDGRYVG
ncbi:MAG: cyclic pyranopterin monophosphate synthase MoaC [Sphaerochaetaceae bacterium]